MVKKSKRKSNLKSSILLLLLLATLLIASSYAWFTANKTVTVSSLDVQVEAQNGIQISADGTNWKTILSNADITGASSGAYASAVNQIPEYMEPVSSGKTIDSSTGYLKMFYGSVEANETSGEYELTATQTTEADGDEGYFIVFDMFIKVDQDTLLYLTPNSGVVTTETSSVGLENAARMAFLIEGNVSTGSALSTIQGLKGATSATTYIWEPNCSTHTDAAISNAYDFYGTTITSTTTVASYSGIKAAISSGIIINKTNATDNATYFNTVTPDLQTASGITANQQLMKLSAGISKVRTYMWVEGQDYDCENNASGSGIQFNIQLTSLDS